MSSYRFWLLPALCVLLLSATAQGATPKPYWWTPAQAVAGIRVYGEEMYVEPERGVQRDLVSVSCRGTGKKMAGRFLTFRCPASFQGTAAIPAYRAVVFAKTRRAGGICFATKLPIPSGCFAPGVRAKGSLTEAFRAVVTKVGHPSQDFSALAHGAGFYSWTWLSGDVAHRGTVTFKPKPVVVVVLS